MKDRHDQKKLDDRLETLFKGQTFTVGLYLDSNTLKILENLSETQICGKEQCSPFPLAYTRGESMLGGVVLYSWYAPETILFWTVRQVLWWASSFCSEVTGPWHFVKTETGGNIYFCSSGLDLIAYVIVLYYQLRQLRARFRRPEDTWIDALRFRICSSSCVISVLKK